MPIEVPQQLDIPLIREHPDQESIHSLFVTFVNRYSDTSQSWQEAWEEFTWRRGINTVDENTAVVIDDAGDLFEKAKSSYSPMVYSHSQTEQPFLHHNRYWVCLGASYGPHELSEAGTFSHYLAFCHHVCRWSDYADDPPAWRDRRQIDHAGRIVTFGDEIWVMSRYTMQIHRDVRVRESDDTGIHRPPTTQPRLF